MPPERITPGEALAFVAHHGDELAAEAIGRLEASGRGAVAVYKGTDGWAIGWQGAEMLATMAAKEGAHPMLSDLLRAVEGYDPHRQAVVTVSLGGDQAVLVTLRLTAVIAQETLDALTGGAPPPHFQA